MSCLPRSSQELQSGHNKKPPLAPSHILRLAHHLPWRAMVSLMRIIRSLMGIVLLSIVLGLMLL